MYVTDRSRRGFDMLMALQYMHLFIEQLLQTHRKYSSWAKGISLSYSLDCSSSYLSQLTQQIFICVCETNLFHVLHKSFGKYAHILNTRKFKIHAKYRRLSGAAALTTAIICSKVLSY